MIIDVRSESSVYVTIGNLVYYLDDSTGECLMTCWRKKEDGGTEEQVENRRRKE